MVTFCKVTDPDMEIIEIELLNGTVAAFPVTDKDPLTGQRYCDLYGAKYAAFKKENEPKKVEPEPVPEPEIKPEPVNQGVNVLPEQHHAAANPDSIPPPPAEHKDII